MVLNIILSKVEIETLLRYFVFSSWEDLLQFMLIGLDLDTS